VSSAVEPVSSSVHRPQIVWPLLQRSKLVEIGVGVKPMHMQGGMSIWSAPRVANAKSMLVGVVKDAISLALMEKWCRSQLLASP
jgi:hypothetical protein